jgi:RHS repeat-associated protein
LFESTRYGRARFNSLSDGHGSTRILWNIDGNPFEFYAYDAFGNMLAGPGLTGAADASTRLLYSGEQTDQTGLQYLRARYYDPRTGRFNRLDPFAGITSDPLSLHKYTYAHNDPVSGHDPTGMYLESLEALLRTIGARTVLAQAGATPQPSGVYFKNGKTTLVGIEIEDEAIPQGVDIDIVNQKMQQAMNAAKMPIVISIYHFPRGTFPQAEDFAGLNRYPHKFPNVVNHYVQLVVEGPVRAKYGQPAVAATPQVVFGYSTKTIVDPEVFNQSFRDVQSSPKDKNAYFANVLLHEVFWGGILERKDETHRPTPLSGPSSHGTIMIIQSNEARLILDQIGFD